MNTALLIILLIVGGGLLMLVALVTSAIASRRRQQTFGSEETPIPVNLASINDAVLIARVGGQITYANEVVRQWFRLESGEPDLWLLSQQVNPPDALFELFAAEGQASFTIGEREVDATSHRIAIGETAQFVITMREQAILPSLDKEDRGSGRALQLLSEVARSINSHLDLDSTVEATFEGVRRLIDFDLAQISLWNQEREVLRPAGRIGPQHWVDLLSQEDQVYGLEDGFTGWVARKRQSLLVDDVPNFSQIQRTARKHEPPYSSYMGVLLNYRSRFIGTFEVMAYDPYRYDREDLALLNLLADQVAIAIENARQYSQQAGRVAELSGLQRIAQAISTLQDPYKLYEQLGRRVSELMETDIGGVLLFDAETEALVAQRPIWGVPDAIADEYQIPLDRGSTARSLWEEATYWFSNNVPEDRLVGELGLGMLVEMSGLKNTAMAIMNVGDERIGVLQVSNTLDGEPFTLEDLQLLQLYADQAAIVVASARLYAEEQSRVAELRGLQQIVQTMGSLTNLNELYAQLSERIAELIGVDICGFLLFDEEEETLVARTPFYGLSDEFLSDYTINVARRGIAREIWREYELFESNNVPLDDTIDALGIRDVTRNAGYRNMLLAPLSAGGRRFGMIQVANKAGRVDFDDGDKRLITIFAGQAAALIDNARLYQDTDETLRKRAAELRSVSRISHELNATLELERILEVIATEAMRAEGARWGNLVLYDWNADDPGERHVMAFGSEVGDEAKVLERAVLRSGDVLVIDDLERVASYPSPIPGARSALLVPIRFEERIVGIIAIYSDQPRGIGASATEYVEALSSQATIAITNATRYAEQLERSDLLARRAEQFTQIFELGRQFRSDQSVEANLTSVARAINEAADFEMAIIGITAQNEESGEQMLRPVASAGVPEATFKALAEVPVDWDVIAPYLDEEYLISGSYLVPHTASQKLVRTLGIIVEPIKGSTDNLDVWHPGTLLLVPLRSSAGETIGVLTVDRPRGDLKPSRGTIELLEIFANQAANVIENSRLYQSVEDRAEELTKSLEQLSTSYGELDRLSQEMIRKDMELSQVNDLLQLRAQRLLALHRVTESVDTSREPLEVLRDIAHQVVEEMDIDQCIIMTANAEGTDNMEVVAAAGKFGDDFEVSDLLTGEDPLSVTCRRGEGIIHAPGKSDPKGTTGLFARAIGAETYVTLPMKLDEHTSASLLIASSTPGAAFDEEDRDMFTLLASQIMIEFENATLYKSVQTEAASAATERDRLQQLHVITTALQQTEDLDMRMTVIARGIRSVGWDRVAMILFNEDMSIDRIITAGYDEEGEQVLRENLPDGRVWQERFDDPQFISMRIGSSFFMAHDHPWVEEHMETGEFRLISQEMIDEHLKREKAMNGGAPPTGEWHRGDQLYLPMYTGSRIIGLINLRNPRDGQMPDESALRPLELFVQQSSSALENTRLYQNTLELQSFTEAVVESIQQGIVVTDTDAVVESLNNFIKDHYGLSDDMIGMSIFEAQPVLAQTDLARDFEKVVKEGLPLEYTNVEYPFGDEVRVVNLYAYPRYDDTKTVTGAVVLLEDVTQRARLEADIALRSQQLAALSDATRRITATLSVDDVIDSALIQAREVISYGQVSLWLADAREETFQIVGARGYTDDRAMTGLTLRLNDDPLFAQIARDKEVIVIGDVREDSRVKDAGIRPARSWLGAPMVSGDNLLGMLVFERTEAHAYAPVDAQVASALANQIAIALQNARLFEEAEDRTEELTSRTQRLALLNRISSTLGGSLDQNSILQTTVDELADALNAPQGSVILFERDDGIGRITIQSPSQPDGSVPDLTIPLEDNPVIEGLSASSAPIVIDDAAKDPRMSAMKKLVKERKMASALILPLVIGNNTIGMLLIEQTESGREFGEGQLELAQTITNQAAISVQNAQLFQETVARRAELGILFEAGRIASSSLDLNNVVESAADYFIRALNVDATTISLWDENENSLTSLIDYSTRGNRAEELAGLRREDLKQYPATMSVLEERGVVALTLADKLKKAEKEWIEAREMKTVLMLPLEAREKTIGLVELWKAKDHVFNQRDIGLARALSATVATAMENARLHDETQQRLDELGRINELSRALTQTISTEDLYQILHDQIQGVLDAPSMTLALPDAATGQLTFPLAVRGEQRIHIDPIGFGADLYSYVIETREPLVLAREADQAAKELGVDHIEENLKSFLAVPLVSGEKVLGVIAVEDYTTNNTFHEADLRVLGPIAAQIAVSMENARLYSELEKRLSETTTLQEVSRVVNSALDLGDIFTRVVEELASAFSYPLIGLYTLEGRDLVVKASHGYAADEVEALAKMSVDMGIVGRAARTGDVQFVQDVTRDEDYIMVKDWARTMVAVPIISDEVVLGVLSVHSGSEHPLGENDVQLLRTFAGQVATATVNANLFTEMVRLSEELEQRVEDRTQQLRGERDRIDTLYRIAVELTASLDLDRVLNRALELVGEAVGADSGSLFLVDPQSDRLIWRALMAGDEILPPGGRQIALTRHEGLAGWVMDQRQSIVLDNVQVDPRWTNVPGTESRRAILGAPLVANEEVLGCIFFNSDTENAFHEGHLQLVEAAAQQVANSINNAELYRLIRDQAERLGGMLRSQQTEAAKSQAILESVADGVMVSDQAGQIILFNAAAERILELRRHEVLGRTTNDLTGLYGAGAERWAEVLDEWSADPTAHEAEFLSEQLSIGPKVVSVHVSPVIHGAEYLGLVSVFRDISREVAADRIKSEFVATVSHELRTPMTSIKGYADLLLLGAAGELNEDQRRFLEIVKSNADRLSLLVNDLLDISRIEQEGLDLEVRPISIGEVVNDVLVDLSGRRDSDDRTVEFKVDIPEDLDKIEGDYDRITQIISNLTTNAYQYTPDEGGVITIRCTDEDSRVRIDVADNGIGIPEDDQERLFERFFRGEHPTIMATAGTGLGLSIVQHLVEMHGGEINFESEEGVGTTFSVWLPKKANFARTPRFS